MAVTSRARLDFGLLVFLLVLVPIAGHAGGLAAAPLLAIAGVLSVMSTRPDLRPRAVIIAGFAALFYMLAASFWSGAPQDWPLNNAVKLLIGAPLFALGAWAAARGVRARPEAAARITLFMLSIGTAALWVEYFTGGQISMMLDPLAPGENPEAKRGDIVQNISHGLSILCVLWPASLILSGGKLRVWALFIGAALLAYAVVSGVSAAIIALIAGLSCAVIGARVSGFIRFVIWGLIVLIMSGPLLGLAAKSLSPEMISALPFSWETRVIGWAHCWDIIVQNPLWGTGFDGLRAETATYIAERPHPATGIPTQFEMAKISLHPHNGALHIWAELGAAGAVLFALPFYMLQRMKLTHYPALAGTIVACAVFFSLSYGVWQDWWWASSALAAGLAVTADYYRITNNISY